MNLLLSVNKPDLMTCLELSFVVPDDELVTEILTAILSEIRFDSFMQEKNILKAYIQKELFIEKDLNYLLKEDLFQHVSLLKVEEMPEQNWNAIWESSYQPVIINELCRIRAPFHNPDSAYPYDLLIEPRMSFGTAHHETTSQMLELMLTIDFVKKSTLDMGCGTAILAILARKMGAEPVVAIDNDEWAFNNALDNIILNHTEDIVVQFGDVSTIEDNKFDIILANINRNILLADMKHYAHSLFSGGSLLLSGFYVADLPSIKESALLNGLIYKTHISKNDWVAALFQS
jgi:ribosomal protein L11 methyltransferase